MTNIEGYGEGGEAFGPDPDPVALVGRRAYEPHPLFPREDGSPEDRDIRYVTFRRRRTGDRLVQNYPEDIPARDVQSWAQVVAWWGGGEYKVIGKNSRHQIEACYPPATDGWESFDGESKPFTFRDSSPYASRAPSMVRAAEPAAPPPSHSSSASSSARAHIEQSAAQSEMAELLREIRAERAVRAAAPPAPAPSPIQHTQLDNNAVLIALINAQAQTAASAAARESENMRAFMSAMLSLKQGPDPTTVAVSMLKAVKDLAQPQSSVNETLTQFKVLKDLTSPATSAGPAGQGSEINDIFNGLTSFFQAETSRATIANIGRSAKEEEPPAPREEPQRKPQLVRVPGLGIVDVVRPEPPTFMPGPPPLPPPAMPPPAPPRVQPELDIEAIKRDPMLRAKLLQSLGVEAPSHLPMVAPPPMAPPPPAPSPPIPSSQVAAAPIEMTTPMEVLVVQPPPMKVAPPVIEPEPLPVSTAVSEPVSTVSTLPVHAEPAAPVVNAPAAPSPANEVQLAPELSTSPIPEPVAVTEPVAAPAPVAMPAPAATPERRVIALPAHMPRHDNGPKERERVQSWLERLQKMSSEQRRREIAQLPGAEGFVNELVMFFDMLPPDALPTVIDRLPPNVRQMLAETGG